MAARRAAGKRRRSVSQNTVAMRPRSCGGGDGYPLTTARIDTAMCQNSGGTQIEGLRGAAPSLSPDPMTHDRPARPLGILPSRTKWAEGVGHQRALRDGLHTAHPVVAIPISVGAASKHAPCQELGLIGGRSGGT